MTFNNQKAKQNRSCGQDWQFICVVFIDFCSFFVCIEVERKPKIKMDELMLRFPHLMEQVLQKLDDKGLLKSREVARSWQEFIDMQQYPWLRIVNIPTILNLVNPYEMTNSYMHLASKKGQIEMFKVILDSETDNNLETVDCSNSLQLACHYSCVKVVKILLTKFDDLKVDFRTRRTKANGNTAFHSACIGGSSEISELIMKNSHKLKIDLNEKQDRTLKTGFIYACQLGHTEIVETIMKNSKSMNIELNTLDFYNRNAFHHACQNDHLEVAKIIMEEFTKLKLDLNAQDKSGFTAFHVACGMGSMSIINMMLDQPEFNLSLKTENGDTGFHLACLNGRTNIVDILINNSESTNLDVTAKDNWGCTGFHSACSAGQTNTVEMLIDKSEYLKLDLTATDNSGSTGYQLAFTWKKWDVIDMIKRKMPSLIL